MCGVFKGRSYSCSVGNLWDNNEPPIMETIVYISLEWKEIGGIINIARPVPIYPYFIPTIPKCLLLWHEMGILKSERKITDSATS